MDDRACVAAQDFLLATKQFWTTRLYPAVREEFRARERKSGAVARTAEDVRALLADSTRYRTYAWLERHLQRFKYAGRYGLAPWHAAHRERLEAALGTTDASDTLSLAPDLPLPRYYTATDIHQHPGGVWSDPVAGFVYERGARTTTPMLGERHRDLHERFTDRVRESVGEVRRILDLGCGFGKSTRPFIEAWPDAQVIGVDFSSPCLRLAARDADAAGAANVRYVQGDATATDFEDGSFDLVTSTMLIHELPPRIIRRLFAETFRLLAPGGHAVHLDFHRLVSPFDRFIHYGHARRNNEPFMEPWAKMEPRAELEAAGFEAAEVEPFKESDATVVDDGPAWRFPWTVISARRPAGAPPTETNA